MIHVLKDRGSTDFDAALFRTQHIIVYRLYTGRENP
jgi:hypothetical protein